jgi:hypothetical protein
MMPTVFVDWNNKDEEIVISFAESTRTRRFKTEHVQNAVDYAESHMGKSGCVIIDPIVSKFLASRQAETKAAEAATRAKDWENMEDWIGYC